MANRPNRKAADPKRQDTPLSAAAAERHDPPAATLALLRNWHGAAQHVLVHIANTRGDQVMWYHVDPIDWPGKAIEVLERTTSQVVGYLRTRHTLDVRAPLERIANAARNWVGKRDAVVSRASKGPPTPEAARELAILTETDLPEQRRLDLDLRIAEGAIRRAEFPLVAGDREDRDPYRVRRLLVRWALWVQDAFAETIPRNCMNVGRLFLR